MVKDRIGNVLANGDRLLIALPESQIFGFVAEIKETSIIRGLKGSEASPGAILVSCVIALPIDANSGQVAQCVKVYDPDSQGGSYQEAPAPN